MKHRSLGLTALIFSSLFILSCTNGDSMQEIKPYMKTIASITEAQWEKLSAQNIYFGHQSVGFNIMDGIADIMKEKESIRFTIKEGSALSSHEAPVFAHSKNGENRDWQSKVDAFKTKFENGLGKTADIAFFKFCYVDIMEETDVDKVFTYYIQTMKALQKEFPNITFIYTTTPLKTAKESWKTWIKKLIGKDHIWEYAANIKRNEFNERVREEYQESGKLFDIARAESTYLDGSRETFEKDGKAYEALVPAFTNDGGHLNELGRRVVAAHLLKILAVNAN